MADMTLKEQYERAEMVLTAYEDRCRCGEKPLVTDDVLLALQVALSALRGAEGR